MWLEQSKWEEMDLRSKGRGQFEKDFGFLPPYNTYVPNSFSPAEGMESLCGSILSRCLEIVVVHLKARTHAARCNWMTLRRLTLPQVIAYHFTERQTTVITDITETSTMMLLTDAPSTTNSDWERKSFTKSIEIPVCLPLLIIVIILK